MNMSLDFQIWLEANKKYGCLMAFLPEKITEKIHQWQKKNIRATDLTDKGLETEIHVTVLYGFHDDNPEKIIKFLKSQKPIKMKLGKVSLFQNEHDVVKISVESEDLHDLNKRLKENFAQTSNHPNYVPHCTLAYLKSGCGSEYANDSTFAGQSFASDKLVFSSSTKEKTKIVI